jgi:DMSO/TMAO reductase YedYZ molybdopterin-dependent catalytic subunit
MRFVGIPFWRLIELVSPKPQAQFVLCHAYENYATNLRLLDVMEPDVLLAHSFNRSALERSHGGQCRMITPQLYAWKGAKWINRIEFRETESLGYWERRGYSNRADPWTDERYSDDGDV